MGDSKNASLEKPKMTDEPLFTVRLTEATDDWMRAGRLQKRAEAGDKEAAAELERMESETLSPDDTTGE